MSDKFLTGKTFISGEQVTATDLNNAVKGATPLVALTDDTTLTVTNNEIVVKDGTANTGISLGKLKHIAAKSIVCNTQNNLANPTNFVLGANKVIRCNSTDTGLEGVSGGISIDADEGDTHEIFLGETLEVQGGTGIETTITDNTLTIDGTDATTSDKGVASFNSGDFSVSSGAVSIKEDGVSNDQIANPSITVTSGAGLNGGGTVNLGGTVTLSVGGNEVTQGMCSFITDSTGAMTLTGTAPSITFNDDNNTGSSPVISGNSNDGNLIIETKETGADLKLQSVDGIYCTTNGNSRVDMGSAVSKTASGTASSAGIKVYDHIWATGDISANGDIAAYVSSDRRLKEDIKPIENALSKVNKLSGNTFKWKDCATYKGDDIGVIAQEVQEIFPSAVRERHDGYLKVDYTRLVPLLLESIKELSVKVQELESKSHTHGIK